MIRFKDEQVRRIYVSIRDSSLCLTSREPKEGYEPFGKGHIRKIDRIEGTIIDISWYDKTHGTNRFMGWKLGLVDDNYPEHVVLDLPFNSTEGTRFMKMARNIDYETPVEITAWKDFERSDKGKTAFAIFQEGHSVKEFWNKDSEEMPQPVQRTSGWDFGEQKDFLKQDIEKVVIPFVKSLASEREIIQQSRVVDTGEEDNYDTDEATQEELEEVAANDDPFDEYEEQKRAFNNAAPVLDKKEASPMQRLIKKRQEEKQATVAKSVDDDIPF